MKYLVAALIITTIITQSTEQYEKCLQNYCIQQSQDCQNDTGCTQTLNKCQLKCGKSKQEKCLFYCVSSSNSIYAQQLTNCAKTNECISNQIQIKKVNEVCSQDCLNPVLQGITNCITESDQVPQYECVSSKLKTTYPNCDAKQCICSNNMIKNINIAGCQ